LISWGPMNSLAPTEYSARSLWRCRPAIEPVALAGASDPVVNGDVAMRNKHRSPLVSSGLLPILLGAAGVVGVGCTTDLVQPDARLHATDAGVTHSTYDPSTRTLGLYIAGGGSRLSPAGYYKVWRDGVEGGVGPYTSYWYGKLCYQDGYCSDMDLWSVTTGDTLTVYVPPDMVTMDLELEVGDSSPDSTWTGQYHKRMLGPVSVTPTPTYYCTGGDDASIGFPFGAFPPDPVHDSTDATGLGHYRVNVCTRGDVWQKRSDSLYWQRVPSGGPSMQR